LIGLILVLGLTGLRSYPFLSACGQVVLSNAVEGISFQMIWMNNKCRLIRT